MKYPFFSCFFAFLRVILPFYRFLWAVLEMNESDSSSLTESEKIIRRSMTEKKSRKYGNRNGKNEKTGRKTQKTNKKAAIYSGFFRIRAYFRG